MFTGSRPPRKPRPNTLRGVLRLAGAGVLAGVIAAAAAFPVIGGTGILARNAADAFENLPGDLQTPPLAQRSRIVAADGSTIATFYYENRQVVPLSQVAPIMRKAIVAIEDSRFYQHGGIDLKGTLRALVTDTRSGGTRQGGSTLTQQYVKNVLIENAKTPQEVAAARAPTLARKLRELRYAITVEKKYSKDQILADYLNISYFGDGAYGIEAAARHYFGKHAKDLDLDEAALLAGIVRNPYGYAPTLHPAAARQRRNVVLARMAQLGVISRAEATRAEAAGLGLHVTKTANGCAASKAPFFCDYVINVIKDNPVFGKTPNDRVQLLLRGGLTIKTTLDPTMQQAAQTAVDRYVPRRDPSHKAAAEVLVEPGTGKIKAIAVDRDFGPEGDGVTSVNFATDYDSGGSHGFQAGSTFKAFTLAAALDKGMGFGTAFHSPQSMTLSGFTDCTGAPAGTWQVANAGDSESGDFDMRQGTAQSVNTYFAQLERKVGLCDTVKTAERLGIHRADGKPLQVVPSFTLGSNEVSPLTVATAYAALAARGQYCKPIAITQVTDAQGRQLAVPGADCKQVLDPSVADAVTYLLQGVIRNGTGKGLDIGRPAAGKTGTTDNYWYAWFAGYTPQLASAVWVGDPRGGQSYPLRDVTINGHYYTEVFGATIPGPIWQDTMIHALAGLPVENFTRPPGRFFTASPFGKNGQGQVPDVVGMPLGGALRQLIQAGYQPRVMPDPADSGFPPGTVTSVSPGAGTPLPKGSTVTVYATPGRRGGPGHGQSVGGPGQGDGWPLPFVSGG